MGFRRRVTPSRFQPALGGNRRHTGGTLVYVPRRAVARPTRPHRIPCHRRANHRRFATPCGSGTASHRIRSILWYAGPQQNDWGGNPALPSTAVLALGLPLDPRLFALRFRQGVGTLVAHGKAGVCARIERVGALSLSRSRQHSAFEHDGVGPGCVQFGSASGPPTQRTTSGVTLTSIQAATTIMTTITTPRTTSSNASTRLSGVSS